MTEQGTYARIFLTHAKNKFLLGNTRTMLMSLENMNTPHTQKTYGNRHAYGCQFQERGAVHYGTESLGCTVERQKIILLPGFVLACI